MREIGPAIINVTLGTSSASAVAGTLSLRGEHDRCTLVALNEAITEAIAGSQAVVTADLSDVTFIGVAPVVALLQAKRLLASQSRDLVVVSASRCARRVIGLCGLTELYGDASAPDVVGPPGALASWVEVPEAPRQGADRRPDLGAVAVDSDEPTVDLVVARPAGS